MKMKKKKKKPPCRLHTFNIIALILLMVQACGTFGNTLFYMSIFSGNFPEKKYLDWYNRENRENIQHC